MKYLRFDNGDKMPALGLGTWKSAPGDVAVAVEKAINIGYRHIDCAPIYGNEKEVGAAFQAALSEGELSRDELWVTSKLWNNAHAPEDVLPALEKTLGDLGLEYLDLYLIHWPVHLRKEATFPRSSADFVAYEQLPMERTWKVMADAKAKGLVRHIGVSNFSVEKLKQLMEKTGITPEVNQIELHPFLQQPAMMEFCRENSILLTAYSPLGSADRPNALKKPDEPKLLDDPVVQQIATNEKMTPAQVLLCWGLRRGTSVIPKSISPLRMEENLAAATMTISEESWQKINLLEKNRRYVLGDFWTTEGSPYSLETLWDE